MDIEGSEEDEWVEKHPYRLRLSMRSKVLTVGVIGILSVGLVTLSVADRISEAWGTMVFSKLDTIPTPEVHGRVPSQPVCQAWDIERPDRPPTWHEQGYGFVNHSIKCWVYYTADFIRINHMVEVEVLNQTIGTMNLTIPYGSSEIRGSEGVFGSWSKGHDHEGELVVEYNQTENETAVFIAVTSEMSNTTNFEFMLVYRVFDLPGFEGVYGFNEAYREGNQRWEAGTHVSFSPGNFDKGTWKLVVEMVGNSGRITPTYWEPEASTQLSFHYESETYHGIEWCYLGNVPETPRFNATYKYIP